MTEQLEVKCSRLKIVLEEEMPRLNNANTVQSILSKGKVCLICGEKFKNVSIFLGMKPKGALRGSKPTVLTIEH